MSIYIFVHLNNSIPKHISTNSNNIMKNSHDNKCKIGSRHLLQHKGFNFLEVTLEN